MRTRTTINFTLFSFAVAALMTSCGGSSSFKTDEATGVQYRFVKHADSGAKPVDGDVVHVVMLWTGKNAKGDADSTYINSYEKGHGDSNHSIPIQLRKSFSGCLEQGIEMMCKGDSAVFQINADSLFLKTFRMPAEREPAAAKTSHMFTFAIKLLSFQSKKDMMALQQAEMQKRMQEAQVLKGQEPAAITAYLQKNNFKGKPDADSIFYLKTIKGKGKQVKEGDSVSVGYTGMFLDGTIFDKSDKGQGTRTLNLLYSKNMSLIKGWISILGKMHEGDKVTVLIPSAMAYGPQGRATIAPYTPLVFDMELVSVKSNK
jgi:FKBP-type peptidyl-prolyl cis-trans isomerase FkpA